MMPQTLTAAERSNPPAWRKACDACIKAKRRCNLVQPTCRRCSLRRIQCQYQPERSRHDSKQGSLQHPSRCTATKTLDPLQPEDAPTVDPLMVDPLTMDTLTADTLTTYFTSSMSDIVDMALSCEQQPSHFTDFPFLDTDHLSPESASSSQLDSINPQKGLFSSPEKDLVRSQSHLIPPRTRQLETLNASIKTRLQYSIDQLTASPRRMVLENGTPWSHPLLYRDSTPRCIQDVQACCALYMAKNSANAPVVLSTLSCRFSDLVSEPLPSSPRELLAHTHALMLYSIMQLFDGDIRALKLAEQYMPALESAAWALLPLITTPDPDSTQRPLSLFPLTSTREFWNDWVFQESARRTFFMTFFYLQVYRLLCGIPHLQCDGKLSICHSWTMSAHLWGARDVIEFAEGWGSRKQFIVTDANIKAAVDGAMADDVDDYAKMIFTALIGIDEFRGWMISRGGKL